MLIVDILLSTFNGSDYIEAQIVSILKQTYSDIRLIIRDDQSEDQTCSIIEKYAVIDSRVIFVKDRAGNLGLVKSLEYLMQISKANYIMFSDQDDVWFPNKVALFIRKAEETNQGMPILIHSDCIVTDRKLKFVKLLHESKPLNYGLNNSLFNFYVQGASTMINLKLKEESLPFPDNIYLHDRYLHIVSEIIGRRKYINEPTMYYRQHDKNLVGSNSLTSKIINNLKCDVKFYHKRDKDLMMSIYANKYPENRLLGVYSELTNEEINRISKILLIIRNKISLRIKEWILILIRN